MALAFSRAFGRLHLTSTAPRLLRASMPTSLSATLRPSFSFCNSVAAGRSLQPLQVTTQSFAHVAFATSTTKTIRGSKSAEKRHRQSEKRRLINKARKNEIKTRMRKVFKFLGGFGKEGPKSVADVDPVQPLIDDACKVIDKAVQKGTLHRNTGSRRKSRLVRAKERLLVQSGLIEAPPKPKEPSLLEQYEARKAAKKAALKQQQLDATAEREQEEPETAAVEAEAEAEVEAGA